MVVVVVGRPTEYKTCFVFALRIKAVAAAAAAAATPSPWLKSNLQKEDRVYI